MTPEDFADLAEILRTGVYDDRLTPAAVDTILAALDLAPVGAAAVAYLDALPLSGASWDAWDALAKAVEQWKREQMK